MRSRPPLTALGRRIGATSSTILTLVAIALLAAASISSCGSAPNGARGQADVPRVPGGVNLGGYLNYKLSEGPAAIRDRTMANIATAGARWIRVDAPDATATEPVIRSALDHGLAVDLLITDDRTADTPSAIGTLATNLARQYSPEGIHTYEVLNEPNAKLSAVAYTAILRASFADIHQVDPAAMVISGGLERVGGRGEPTTYLSAMYAAGAKGSMDAIGIHPYTYPDLPDRATTSDGIEAVMQSHGDGTKQIWITEFGVPTGPDNGYPTLTESFQAHSITDAFSSAKPVNRFGPLFVFDWQDDPGGDFGLNDVDGKPKPALRAFTDAIRG